MRAAKVQASLRIRTVSPEPSLLAHTSSESRGTFRQKARSIAPLNGWACAVEICHDGMLEDTNSLDGAHIKTILQYTHINILTKQLLTTCGHPWQFMESFTSPNITIFHHKCHGSVTSLLEPDCELVHNKLSSDAENHER